MFKARKSLLFYFCFTGVLVWLAPLFVDVGMAGKPVYRYGDKWWEEYRVSYPKDKSASLLLHFGPAQRSEFQKLEKKVKEQKEQDQPFEGVLDEGDSGEGGADTMKSKISPEDEGPTPPEEIDVPEGAVLDYSFARRILNLNKHVSVTSKGKFGEGLRLKGTGKWTLKDVQTGFNASVECWLRIPQYPEKPVCIFSVKRDETRLLLLPDGRLRVQLRKPHGNIPDSFSKAKRKAIKKKDTRIISPDPIPRNTWTHVMIYNEKHVVQGGSPPFDATLKINGRDVANYLGEKNNHYRFLGRRGTDIAIGDTFAGGQSFTGTIDELRVCSSTPALYVHKQLAWRDKDASRDPVFGKPYFRRNGELFHWPLDKGTEFAMNKANLSPVEINLRGMKPKGLEVPAVRGKGWLLKQSLDFPKLKVKKLDPMNGTLEFWMRPTNWDDLTGYWHHTPPEKPTALSVARFYGQDPKTGKVRPFMNVRVPRCHNLERSRLPIDPGHWMHCVVRWNDAWLKGGNLFVDGDHVRTFSRAKPDVLKRIEPLYIEFGVSDKVQVKYDQPPGIIIDEVAGYNYPFDKDEIRQAYARWKGDVEPIKLYNESFSYKYSIRELTFSLKPRLPPGKEAAKLTIRLRNLDKDGKVVRGPLTDDSMKKGKFRVKLNDGEPFPYGKYRFDFTISNPAGDKILQAHRDWHFKQERWRRCEAGIVNQVFEPWTPIEVNNKQLKTRMTTYQLTDGGLPQKINADGKNILAAPVQFLEEGKPVDAEKMKKGNVSDASAEWSSVFRGNTCDVRMQSEVEFDGMMKYRLKIDPNAERVKPLKMVFPLKPEFATRYLVYRMGARGVKTGKLGDQEGTLVGSRTNPVPRRIWKAYKKKRKQQSDLKWSEYWNEQKEDFTRYSFYGHLDINNMNRGLWWFCNNAAGWRQFKDENSIKIVRENGVVKLVLNFIPKASEYNKDKPLVFAILPHPARPLPEKYRLYDRASYERAGKASSIFDAFITWTKNPKADQMKLYPAPDPDQPEEGPSWAYAESCIPYMKADKPHGYRSMYLSKKWFSCRVGRYDNWEWRSGPKGAVTLTHYFNNYLNWEMKEWIGRDIFNAIYLDECYEEPAKNLKAGFSIKLPDGSQQPGLRNFQFRELMKRWRNLFGVNGKEPMLIGHHTRSWQYHGLVFCKAYLDGENFPIVSLQSPDWIESTSKTRFEVIQNCHLWGMSSFYMPYISEGGFSSEQDQYPKWQWRMARQAQSMFAHYEMGTVYEGQGSDVYDKYWNDVYEWGGGHADKASFHPYWQNGESLDVDDQGGATQVSFYKKKNGILLIASNRKEEKRKLRIELDLDRLYLPGNPAVKDVDSGFDPPRGAAYVSSEEADKKAEKLKEETVESGLVGDDSEDEEVANVEMDNLDKGLEDPEARKKAEMRPRMKDGNILVLPVRPRDFRLIKIGR